MYDALKRKCITPSTFGGGEAVCNDRARNALSTFTIPIGSDHGKYQLQSLNKLRFTRISTKKIGVCINLRKATKQ